LAHEAKTDRVFGVIFSGRRYDTGDKLDYLKATLKVAIDREDIGQELRVWLKDFSKGL
jgi:UTP--glucose-1-phosphate uridylyltransferase